jgi:hypothetical protein
VGIIAASHIEPDVAKAVGPIDVVKLGGAGLYVPLLFNIVMVDKTRDFVIAIIPLALLIHKPIFDLIITKLKSINKSDKKFYIGLFLYFIIIFPSIEITFEGRPRAPFEWVVTKFLEMFN